MRSTLTRRVLLPLVNRARGEDVRRELAFLERSAHLGADELQALQLARLRDLLRRAADGSPFYRRRFQEHGADPDAVRGLDDLAKFPSLDKADLPALLADTRQARGGLSGLQVRKTAGSSGHPSVVVADGLTNARTLAARYRAFAWYGIRPGDKEIRFWGRPLREGLWKHRLKSGILNRVVVDSACLNEAAIGATARRIASTRRAYVYGYSSMVMSFVENVERQPDLFAGMCFQAAVCTSETITAFERQRIAAALHCPVVREYGCSETDIIAFECPQGSLHVVDENVIVEIDRTAAADGDNGEIVITDLNNHVMPLIRYRLGDLGALAGGRCGCGRSSRVLASLLGRQMGQYVKLPDGRLIHSQVIAYAFEDLVASGYPIRRFRVVQVDAGTLLIRIATDPEASRRQEEIERLVAQMLSRTLSDTRLAYRFEFVPETEFRARDRKFTHFESRLT